MLEAGIALIGPSSAGRELENNTARRMSNLAIVRSTASAACESRFSFR